MISHWWCVCSKIGVFFHVVVLSSYTVKWYTWLWERYQALPLHFMWSTDGCGNGQWIELRLKCICPLSTLCLCDYLLRLTTHYFTLPAHVSPAFCGWADSTETPLCAWALQPGDAKQLWDCCSTRRAGIHAWPGKTYCSEVRYVIMDVSVSLAILCIQEILPILSLKKEFLIVRGHLCI